MFTIPVGDVSADVDLSHLSSKNRDIIIKRTKEKMKIIRDAKNKKRIKIVFFELPWNVKKNKLEERCLECNNSIIEKKKGLFELVVKTYDSYFIKYIINIEKMELTVYFEEQILKRDSGSFSLTLNGLDYALLNLFLIKYKHLMVHSSAFIFNDKAYLFLGHSRYGKSTIYNNIKNNLKGASLLSEDRNIILLRNNEVYVCDFWREFVSLRRERFYNKIAKIEKIYFIEKSDKNEKKQISVDESKLRLFNFFFRYPNDKLFIQNATNLIFDITTLFNNFYMLKFTKDSSFIDFIRSEVSDEI